MDNNNDTSDSGWDLTPEQRKFIRFVTGALLIGTGFLIILDVL